MTVRPSPRALGLTALAALLASVAATRAQAGPSPAQLRIYVEDDLAFADAPALQIQKQLRLRKTLRLVDEPQDADVRVYVLSSGRVGERRFVADDTNVPASHLDPYPAQTGAEAGMDDTREFVLRARIVGGDRNDELDNGRRATKLANAAKGLASEIDAWIRAHQAEILASRRASAP